MESCPWDSCICSVCLQNENLSDHEEFHMKAVDAIQSLNDRITASTTIYFFESGRFMIVQCKEKASDGIQSLHGHVRAPINIAILEDTRLMVVQCDKKAVNGELIEAIVNTAVEKSYRIKYYNTQ